MNPFHELELFVIDDIFETARNIEHSWEEIEEILTSKQMEQDEHLQKVIDCVVAEITTTDKQFETIYAETEQEIQEDPKARNDFEDNPQFGFFPKTWFLKGDKYYQRFLGMAGNVQRYYAAGLSDGKLTGPMMKRKIFLYLYLAAIAKGADKSFIGQTIKKALYDFLCRWAEDYGFDFDKAMQRTAWMVSFAKETYIGALYVLLLESEKGFLYPYYAKQVLQVIRLYHQEPSNCIYQKLHAMGKEMEIRSRTAPEDKEEEKPTQGGVWVFKPAVGRIIGHFLDAEDGQTEAQDVSQRLEKLDLEQIDSLDLLIKSNLPESKWGYFYSNWETF